MQTTTTLIEDQWSAIRRLLPEDLNISAREHGAMKRKRGAIENAEQLLRLILMHAAGGLSLEQTVARAKVRGHASLNAMALHKRLCTSHRWLQSLTAYLIDGIKPFLQYKQELWPSTRKLRILDGTDIQEPGSTGTDWRIHYSVSLPSLCCDFFELTDAKGGESLKRLPCERGDIVLVDRAYNDRLAVAALVEIGADVILRLHSSAFPLLDVDGAPFEPLDWLRELSVGDTAQKDVQFACEKKSKTKRKKPCAKLIQARICAIRKSPEEARKAQSKALRKAQKNGVKIRQRTLDYAEYIIVITTLPEEEMSLSAVLECYRCRWQVELAFKRLKTLLELGHVPKTKAESSQAWMQGKILTALLIERILCEARFFSPWGYPVR